MNKFRLTSESTVDLTPAYLRERQVDVIKYTYLIKEEEFVDDMWETEGGLEEFYKKIDENLPKTSQINVARYVEFFEDQIEKAQGQDILHLVFGTGMTQSLNNAKIAREMILEKYPQQRLELVDSLASSSGFGLLLDYACDLRDEGKTIDEVKDWLLENRLRVHHRFYTTTLDHLRRGGRISGPVATIATILKICPMLMLDNEGKIIAYDKVRGKKRAMMETAKIMEDLADLSNEYDGKCFISHSNCYEDAKDLADEIEKKFPNLENKIKIFDIGPIIASHTGPGTVALFFLGQERKAFDQK
ncbi:MAG: DegV family protein [Tissierellia bacterium]|nr:DegV family protein [Tissierellia bacterium]